MVLPALSTDASFPIPAPVSVPWAGREGGQGHHLGESLFIYFLPNRGPCFASEILPGTDQETQGPGGRGQNRRARLYIYRQKKKGKTIKKTLVSPAPSKEEKNICLYVLPV